MKENYLYIFSLQSEIIRGTVNLSPLELLRALRDKDLGFLLIYNVEGTEPVPVLINTHRIISIQLLE